MKRFSLLIPVLFLLLPVYAQKQLKGTVKDSNGEPLIGANIVISGTKSGTVADLYGNFTLNLSSDIRSVDVSYVGYKAQVINVSGKTEIHVVLEEDRTYLDEVVVVGYGKQKRVSITGSVSAVTNEEITKRNAPNLSTALQGLMPGVSVVQLSGRPGADGGQISIRGKGSMNSSTSPLVLIDGVEGDMNALDMNAVESVSVLKDASAAIYGSRSSNGVILITTKRGTEQGVKFSYNGYFGATFPTEMPEPLDGVEFMEYMNLANRNSGGVVNVYDQHRIDEYKRYGADGWYNFDTDWKNEMLKKSSNTHKHTLSISGGSERIRYFINGSYQYQDGLMENNNFDRKSLRMNTDLKINKWAKMGLDLSLRNNRELIPTQTTPENLIGQALTYSPILAGINSDGSWGEGLNGYNPIAILKAGGTKDYQVTDAGARASLTLTPFKDFELYTLYSLRLQDDKSSSFTRPYDVYVQGVNKYRYPTGNSANGKANEWWKKNLQTQFNMQATYEKKLAKHTLKGLAGMQVEYLNTESLGGTKYGFYVPGYEELNNGTENQTVTSNHDEWAMVSYYGKLNYDYASKILFELTGRYEGTSRFINNRWSLFPGGSAAWRISEEDFFSPIKDIVNEMKIRASYGHFGNQWLSDSYYPYISQITTNTWNGYFFNNTEYLGSIQNELHNEYISWETSKQFNAGVDLAFLRNRLYVNLDVFKKRVSNTILKPTAPAFVIYKSAFFNIGELSNTGFDLQVIWRDKIGKFGYSVTGAFSDAKSVIEKLTRLTDSGGLNAMQEGSLLNSVRGWVTDGYYQSQDEIDRLPAMIEKANLKPGDIRYRDLNGDDVINYGDIKLLGDGNPRYEYSLNTTAEWNNFDFTLFLQGVGKRAKRYNGNGIIPFNQGRSMYRSQLDFWTEDNRNAQFPRLSLNNSNNYYASDFWVKSAAYMRIKNVVIGYSIPHKALEKIKMDYVRFYVSGQNLFTFKKTFEGFDPEADNAYDSSFYPIMRVVSIGVDVRF